MKKTFFILVLSILVTSLSYASDFIAIDPAINDPLQDNIVIVESRPAIVKRTIIVQEPRKFKPGIITGTIRFVVSGIELVSHTIGSWLWDGSDILRDADTAPERTIK